MNVSLGAGGVLVAVAAGALALWLIKRAKPGQGLFDPIDPTSRNNVVYTGVNSVGASISGDPYWSLGGWVYDITHPGTVSARDTPFQTPPYNPDPAQRGPYVNENSAILGLPI